MGWKWISCFLSPLYFSLSFNISLSWTNLYCDHLLPHSVFVNFWFYKTKEVIIIGTMYKSITKGHLKRVNKYMYPMIPLSPPPFPSSCWNPFLSFPFLIFCLGFKSGSCQSREIYGTSRCVELPRSPVFKADSASDGLVLLQFIKSC